MNEKETTSTGGTRDVTIRLGDGRRLLALEVGKSDGPPFSIVTAMGPPA